MCVLAIAWRAHAGWPLVLLANRDERHARAADPLHRWADDARVLAGRDRLAGGGWLGVSERGVIASVTNARTGVPPSPDAPSRGRLVRDLLLGSGDFATIGTQDLARFNPMNLLRVDRVEARVSTNSPAPRSRALEPGFWATANGPLDGPDPRADDLKAELVRQMGEAAPDLDRLLAALGDKGEPPGPSRPIFLRHAEYGTRCSTVVRVDAAGRGDMVERRFGPDGRETGETRLDFRWPV